MEHSELMENEVTTLMMLADGNTVLEIADELHKSVHTVHGYRKNILHAFGAKTTAHAIALAYHEGILVPRRRVA